MTTKNNEDIFKSENEAKSNWFKFQKIGDKVSGVLVEKGQQEATKDFGAQMVYNLELPDGTVERVGIAVTKEGTISRANSARMGDTLGFLYDGDIQTEEKKKKGHAPAKSIKVFVSRRPLSADEQFDQA